ncbi:MAG: ATP-binding protein [Acidimicrobiia bacterium]|nr:ATP-binding protein [Acidimicrobiia bacterium]
MIRRNLARPLGRFSRQLPVVAVTGPRQSGKTTLCRQTFPNLPYVSLEPLDTRSFAIEDPRGFIHQHRNGAIFDEIQRAPNLFSYLQEEVDRNPVAGRFILTGSQHFGLSEAISQSLAGRIATLHLLPPSLDELARFGPLPEDLWGVIWTGSYPRIFDQGLDPNHWLADYTATYVQRDVRQVLNVASLDAFTSFLRLSAGRTACEINLSKLGADAGISYNTVRAWLSVLEASFLCLRLPAWHNSLRKQAVKAPKLHFLDTGLACHLFGITHPDQLRHHPLRGALFETWAVSEIYKSRLHRRLEPRMFHLRDAKGLEVDLVIEEGGNLTAVEMKSGATLAPDFFDSLKLLDGSLDKRRTATYTARLVYGGDQKRKQAGVDAIGWRRLHELDW